MPNHGDAGGAFVSEIESLRGIAITLVFLLHFDGWMHFGQPEAMDFARAPLWRVLIGGGQTGVSLFFILSGFLLGRPFVAEALQGTGVKRATYYARRALRILPLYFVAVAAAAILCAGRPADVLRGIPYLFFLQAIPGLTTPLGVHNAVWWSLATEVQFYLLLPLLPFFLRSARGRRLGAVIVLVYVGVYAAFLSGRLHLATRIGQFFLYLSLFGRAPQFACGIAAGWLYDRFGIRIRTWAAATPWVRGGGADLGLLALLCGLGMLMRYSALTGWFQLELRCSAWHIAEGLLWTAVLLTTLLAPLKAHALFCNRPWAFLGRISYSLYLVHNPLIPMCMSIFNRLRYVAPMGRNLPSVVIAALTVAACVGLSALSYRVIERPFLRRKAQLPRWVPAVAVPVRDDLQPRSLVGDAG